MVASIPVYAVLNFKAGKPSTDAALDMIEITWDAKGTGPADNPYGVAVETFVAPGTHSGAKLKNQSSLDLDGDGTPETLQTHTMTDHHLANRSTPDALGRSTNPTGWEQDTQTTDADEPHARIQIHMSSIGTPVQK